MEAETGTTLESRCFLTIGNGWGCRYHLFFDKMSLARSLLTEADAGHTEFTDEVYQNESRYPGGEWKPAEDTYTDAVSGPDKPLHVSSVK